jgi:hypothetical protein
VKPYAYIKRQERTLSYPRYGLFLYILLQKYFLFLIEEYIVTNSIISYISELFGWYTITEILTNNKQKIITEFPMTGRE